MSNEDHPAVERMCDINAEQFALAKARRGIEARDGRAQVMPSMRVAS